MLHLLEARAKIGSLFWARQKRMDIQTESEKHFSLSTTIYNVNQEYRYRYPGTSTRGVNDEYYFSLRSIRSGERGVAHGAKKSLQ